MAKTKTFIFNQKNWQSKMKLFKEYIKTMKQSTIEQAE